MSKLILSVLFLLLATVAPDIWRLIFDLLAMGFAITFLVEGITNE